MVWGSSIRILLHPMMESASSRMMELAPPPELRSEMTSQNSWSQDPVSSSETQDEDEDEKFSATQKSCSSQKFLLLPSCESADGAWGWEIQLTSGAWWETRRMRIPKIQNFPQPQKADETTTPLNKTSDTQDSAGAARIRGPNYQSAGTSRPSYLRLFKIYTSSSKFFSNTIIFLLLMILLSSSFSEYTLSSWWSSICRSQILSSERFDFHLEKILDIETDFSNWARKFTRISFPQHPKSHSSDDGVVDDDFSSTSIFDHHDWSWRIWCTLEIARWSSNHSFISISKMMALKVRGRGGMRCGFDRW